MSTSRAEHRADLRARILDAAGAELARVGPSELSMRAIARAVGLTPGALYRYVADRDALLTELIVQAYDSLGAAVERAIGAGAGAPGAASGGDLDRWRAAFHAAREWAAEHEREFSLLYGTPVIGYRAPSETIGPASRLTSALARIVVDAALGGRLEPAGPLAAELLAEAPPELAADLAAVRDILAAEFPELPEPPDEARIALLIAAWTELVGTIAFERFGHYRGSIEHAAPYLDVAARRTGLALGLR